MFASITIAKVPHEDNGMNKKGITLLELIIVMVIIAIGAALMVPGFGAWMPHYRLKSAARDIVSTMRTAQMRAVSNNMRYGVAFNTEASPQEFRLYRNSGGLTDFQVDGSPMSLPAGVVFNDIAGLPKNGPGDQYIIRFFPDSTAEANGTIDLINSKNSTKSIQISQSTGRIRIP
jgi:prepilin-type N-terminal cleavage/methylation domain-containing protein